jgi:DNA-binding winged helix-turn-helix (wHTH) protein/tetratricopeptide (TPR) repeat protein
MTGRCKFGVFELDPGNRILLKNGRKLKVQEQPFQILSALVDRSGEVVTREELRQRLWPSNTFVDFDNSLSIAVGKLRLALRDDASKPRYIETLPRVGYRFIAAVEVEQPAVAEPPPATAVEPTTEAVPVKQPARQWRWGLTSIVVLLGVALWIPFSAKLWFAGATVPLRPSVAVMGFRNQAARPDRDWESTAFSEWLALDLEDGERIRAIPGESVARAKSDLALPAVDAFSAGTLARIRKNTGADYVVAGWFLDAGGQPGGKVRLDLRMQDARKGETVLVFSRTGTSDDLPGLAKLAGIALRQKLGLEFAPQADVAAHVGTPASPSAHLYFEGLDKLRHFDARGARDLLEQAVAADPNDALAHNALSQSWAALGYAELAKREAQKAWELSAKLPRADRLSIEAGYRAAGTEWDKAIRIYRQLLNEFPDTADYGLRLARAQIAAGKAKDALATLDRLRKLPSPAVDDAAIRIVQSEAEGELGDFEQARTLASAAAASAQARGAQILVAQARALECRHLIQLGRAEQGAAACESAREIYARSGDRAGLAASMGYLASTRFMLGDLAGARSLYSQALDIDREIGSEDTAMWERNGLATVFWQEGDLASARRQYQESLRIARLISSRPDEADALENIAFTWMLEGDLPQARDLLQQALARFQAMGDKAGAGSVWNNLGQAQYLSGDLEEAADTLGKALAADRETGYKQDAADALASLGRVRLAEANWDDARRQFEDSVRTAQETGNNVFVAQCRVAMAGLSLATGRPAAAESSLRESLALFEKQKRRRAALEARTLLAEALLEEGKTADARDAVNRGEEEAKASPQLAPRLEFAIVAARVAAANKSGQPAAVRNLQNTIGEAAQHGLVSYQLEARLALAEIESKRGVQNASRDLQKLERDARARGFEAIARRAAAARVSAGAPG